MSPRKRSTGLSKRDEWRIAMLADSDLEWSHRCVLVALSERMDFDTLENAYPGDTELIERTGASESTVYRARKAGERAGWIELVREGGLRQSGSTASVYRGTFAPTNEVAKAALVARLEAREAKEKSKAEKVARNKQWREEDGRPMCNIPSRAERQAMSRERVEEMSDISREEWLAERAARLSSMEEIA